MSLGPGSRLPGVSSPQRIVAELDVWVDAYQDRRRSTKALQTRLGIESQAPSRRAAAGGVPAGLSAAQYLPSSLPSQLKKMSRVGQVRAVLPSIDDEPGDADEDQGATPLPSASSPSQRKKRGKQRISMQSLQQQRREEKQFARALVQMELGLFCTGDKGDHARAGLGDSSMLAQLYLMHSPGHAGQRRQTTGKSSKSAGALESRIEQMKLRSSVACGVMDRLCATPLLQKYHVALRLVRNALFRSIFAGVDDHAHEDVMGGSVLSYTQRMTFAEQALRGLGALQRNAPNRRAQGATEATRFVAAWRELSTADVRGQALRSIVLAGTSLIVAEEERRKKPALTHDSSASNTHAEPATCTEVKVARETLQELWRAISKAIVAMSGAGGADDGADTIVADGVEHAAFGPLKIDDLELERPIKEVEAKAGATSLPEEVGLLNALQKQELLHELFVLHALDKGVPGAVLDTLSEFQAVAHLRLEPVRLVSAGIGCMLAACHERREQMLDALLSSISSDVPSPVLRQAVQDACSAAASIRGRGRAILQEKATELQRVDQRLATHTMAMLGLLVRGAQHVADDADSTARKAAEREQRGGDSQEEDDEEDELHEFHGVELTPPQRLALCTLLGALAPSQAQQVMAAIAVQLNKASTRHNKHLHHHEDLHRKAIMRRATGRHSSIPADMKMQITGGFAVQKRARGRRESTRQIMDMLHDSQQKLKSAAKKVMTLNQFKQLGKKKRVTSIPEDDGAALAAARMEEGARLAAEAEAARQAAADTAAANAKAAAERAQASRAAQQNKPAQTIEERIRDMLMALQNDDDAQASLLESLVTMMSENGSDSLRSVLYDLASDGKLSSDVLESIEFGAMSKDPTAQAGRLVGEVNDVLKSPTAEADGSKTLMLELLAAGLTDDMLATMMEMRIKENVVTSGGTELSAWQSMVASMSPEARAALLQGLAAEEARDHAIASVWSKKADSEQADELESTAALHAGLQSALGKAVIMSEAGTQIEVGDFTDAEVPKIRLQSVAEDSELGEEDSSALVPMPSPAPKKKGNKRKVSKAGKGGETPSRSGMSGTGKGSLKDIEWAVGNCVTLFDRAIELDFLGKIDDDTSLSFDEFCFQSFLRQFGVASLARKKMSALMKSVRHHAAGSVLLRSMLAFIEPRSPEQTRRIKFLLGSMVKIQKELNRRPLFPPEPKSNAVAWLSLDRVHAMLPQFFPDRCGKGQEEHIFTRSVKARLNRIKVRGPIATWKLPRHKGYQLARTWRVHRRLALEVLLGAENEDDGVAAAAMSAIMKSIDFADASAEDGSMQRSSVEALYKAISPKTTVTIAPRFAQTTGAEFCELVRNASFHTELLVFIAFMGDLGVGMSQNKQKFTLGHLKNELEMDPVKVRVLCEDLGFSLTEQQLHDLDEDGSGMISWGELTESSVWQEIVKDVHAVMDVGDTHETKARQFSMKALATAALCGTQFRTSGPETIAEDDEDEGDADEMNMLALQLHPMFRMLDDDERKIVLKVMEVRRFKRGDVIIKEGDIGHSMFVLKQGKVGVRLAKVAVDNPITELDKLGKEVAELSEPDFFGDLALTESDSTRSATIVAKASCELLEFPRTGFEQLLATSSKFKESMAERKESLVLVKQVPLFKNLPLKIAEEILALCKKEEYSAGSLIIEQGDEADCMYFIKSGNLDVTLRGVGHVATMTAGKFFGERTLFEEDQDVRTASVSAAKDSEVQLLTLYKDDFTVLLEDFPAFAREVENTTADHYIDDDE